jgi:hypothetical protein
LGDGGIPDETDDALGAFGLVRAKQEDTDTPFPVYWFNWDTLYIFCSTWMQWKRVVVQGRTVRDCIDWPQVESALNLNGIKRAQWPTIFVGLRAMQDEAIEYLSRS